MSITVELPDDVTADLVRRAQRIGQSPERFIAEALRRQLAVEQFRETRERLSHIVTGAGLDTDEDVFAAVS